MSWIDPFAPKRPIYDWNAHNKRLAQQKRPNPIAPAPAKPATPPVAKPATPPIAPAPAKPATPPIAPAPAKPATPPVAKPATPAKPNVPIDPSIRQQAEDRHKRGTTWEQEEWKKQFGGSPDAEAQARAQRLAQIASFRNYLLNAAKTEEWARAKGKIGGAYDANEWNWTIARNLQALNQYEQYVRNGGDINFNAYLEEKAAENGGHIPGNAMYRYYDIDTGRTHLHDNFDLTDPRNAPLWGINI